MAFVGLHVQDNGSSNVSYSNLLDAVSAQGATALRMDVNWTDFQPFAPTTHFNLSSANYGNSSYKNYLENRGYGPDGGVNLSHAYDVLKSASDRDLSTVFNFGVVPAWASSTGAQDFNSAFLNDPKAVGAFLADLIIYISRQSDGLDVLESMSGWQLFNEVNNYDQYIENGISYDKYFKMVEETLKATSQAYDIIGLDVEDRPSVIGPALAEVVDDKFWDAFFEYTPKYPDLTTDSGFLAIESISLNAYGRRIDPWTDPETGENLWVSNPEGYGLPTDNLTYHKTLMPTSDRWTWEQSVARDRAENDGQFGLRTYAEDNNPGDAWFDNNTEIGVEKTMARLYQAGLDDIELHLTEWGASSTVGVSSNGEGVLFDTIYADPFKYGMDVYKSNGELRKNAAENLQAEAVMETVGLLEDWDMLGSATAYQLVDETRDPNSEDHQEFFFGLAYADQDANGNLVYKPAGHALNAYMSGIEYHANDLSGYTDNIGVDIHIASEGKNGAFNNASRDTSAHELILTREGHDTVSGGAGDDIIFGGSGNDVLRGDSGWDRLYGGSGNDTLSGGAGSDKIKGGTGNDQMTGGSGADQFVFSVFGHSGTSGYAGHDVITDFKPGEDIIQIVGGYKYSDINFTNNADGVLVSYGNNGATIQLWNVSASELSASDFRILQTDEYEPPSESYYSFSGSEPKNVDLSGYLGAKRTLIDSDDGKSWAVIVDSYDQEWVQQSRSIKFDEGHLSKIQFDGHDEKIWDVIRTAYDQDNRLYLRQYDYDDGDWRKILFDTDSEKSWDILTNSYGQGNHLEWRKYEYDNGDMRKTLYDVGNEKSWDIITNAYDQANHLEWRKYEYDNGAMRKTLYDAANEKSWDIITNAYDQNNHLEWRKYEYDNGEMRKTLYDAANEKSWEIITTSYDQANKLDWKKVFYDDGARTVIDFDQSDEYGWSRIESKYDADGELFDKNVYDDTGSLIV